MEASRDQDLVCSARGCREPAAWGLLWNNPKIHSEERRKTWLACEEHRDSLADFLRARSFLREVRPVADLPPLPGDAFLRDRAE